MKTICLACVVYTMKGVDPKDNLYLNIFYQWLSMVIKNGDLQPCDMLHILIDSVSLDYLENEDNAIHEIIPVLKCDFQFHKFEQPDTPLKGMMHKYVFTEYIQDAYIYCDIDVIIRKPFRLAIDKMTPNTMYFSKEYSLDLYFYSEGFPSEFPMSSDLPGFGAGIFVILGKGLRDAFFSRIYEICDYSSNYKSVEQPLFNRAIYEIPRDKISVDITILTEHVSFNGQNFSEENTIFYNLAGETSNGLSHFKNMSDYICKYIVTSS